MNYGAKVAKAGHTVANPDAPAASGNQLVDTVKEMVSTLSLAFILGATKQIGVHQNLMVHIGFDENAIKMGGTVLTLDEASQYIEWATNILTEVIAGAIKAGRIKGAKAFD